jgi:hypothetical protein
VLDKTKMDWQDFKSTDAAVQEELEAHKRSDKQYLDRQVGRLAGQFYWCGGCTSDKQYKDEHVCMRSVCFDQHGGVSCGVWGVVGAGGAQAQRQAVPGQTGGAAGLSFWCLTCLRWCCLRWCGGSMSDKQHLSNTWTDRCGGWADN